MGIGSSNVFPVHVLGHSYEDKNEAALKSHTETLFRFTYRRNMPPLCCSSITSDGGWGCMLRAAQMLMGNTLQRHHLGPDWRLPPNVTASRVRKSRVQALAENSTYCDLVRWFTDYPDYPHLYSLHHLVNLGVSRYEKPAGQWVGPSTAAYMLRDLARLHCALYGGSMEVLVTQGDTIYISEALDACTRTSEARNAYVQHLIRQTHQETDSDSEDEIDIEKEAAVSVYKEKAEIKVPLHPLLNQAYKLHQIPCNNAVLADGGESTRVHKGEQQPAAAAAAAEVMEAGSASADSSADSRSNKQSLRQGETNFFDPLLRPPPKERVPWNTALLVLVPLRLGIHSLNEEYYEEIKEVLRHPNCTGILGGRPNHAIYFVGYRGDYLLGLDPHTVFDNAPAGPPKYPSHPCSPPPFIPPYSSATSHNTPQRKIYSSTFTNNSSSRSKSTGDASANVFSVFSGTIPGASSADSHLFPSVDFLSQVHVDEFVTLEISRLDPSLTVGFYFPTHLEFEEFCENTKIATAKKMKAGKASLYNVQNKAPTYMYSDEEEAWSGKGIGKVKGNNKSRERSSTDTADLHASGFDLEDNSSEEGYCSKDDFDSGERAETTEGKKAVGRKVKRNSKNSRNSRGINSFDQRNTEDPSSEDEDYVLV